MNETGIAQKIEISTELANGCDNNMMLQKEGSEKEGAPAEPSLSLSSRLCGKTCLASSKTRATVWDLAGAYGMRVSIQGS